MAHLIECDVDGCKAYENAPSGYGHGVPEGWSLVHYTIAESPEPPQGMEMVVDGPAGPMRMVGRSFGGMPPQRRPVAAHVCPQHALPKFKTTVESSPMGISAVPYLGGASVGG